MFLIWSFAICLARRSGTILGTNASTSGFGFHLGSSPPISKLHTSCKGRSTMYPFPCFSFNPWTVPSLPVILLTTRHSFHIALSFASPFNITTAPVLGILSLFPSDRCCLSSRAWTYSFMNLFRRCCLLISKNLMRLVTFSSPIFSRSSSRIGIGST